MKGQGDVYQMIHIERGKKMKFSFSTFSKVASVLAIAAVLPAAHAADFDDYARVIRVTPQVEQVNVPRQECRTEYETTQRSYPRQQAERSNGGAVIGGIAGGLLGSQVGGGNGRLAATAAGAITGALVGDRVDNGNNGNNYNNQPEYERRPVRQCRNIDSWETRNNGYAVTYEYNNRTYTSVLPYDPGSRMRVHVSLTPRP